MLNKKYNHVGRVNLSCQYMLPLILLQFLSLLLVFSLAGVVLAESSTELIVEPEFEVFEDVTAYAEEAVKDPQEFVAIQDRSGDETIRRATDSRMRQIESIEILLTYAYIMNSMIRSGLPAVNEGGTFQTGAFNRGIFAEYSCVGITETLRNNFVGFGNLTARAQCVRCVRSYCSLLLHESVPLDFAAVSAQISNQVAFTRENFEELCITTGSTGCDQFPDVIQ